jgi:flagellar biosynthesis/type III secretory pathway protein FliH
VESLDLGNGRKAARQEDSLGGLGRAWEVGGFEKFGFGKMAGRQEGRKAGRQEGRKAGRQEGRKAAGGPCILISLSSSAPTWNLSESCYTEQTESICKS